MAEQTLHHCRPPVGLGVMVYLGISALVFVLMMVLGVLMRLSQATWLELTPNLFYEVMTAHGAGMVGISGLAASGVIWYFPAPLR